jgi:2'-5' RNA ligase
VSDRWYWGVVVRLDEADGLLGTVARVATGPAQHPQRPGTGHVTLLYAPLRGPGACDDLAERARDAARGVQPFTVELHGAGEFPTASRVVAWLAVERGISDLRGLRRSLKGCDTDVLPYAWIPHCTVLYAEDPPTYSEARRSVREVLDEARLTATVDALWVAGFPASGHPARDLEYRLRIPLG